MSEGPQPRLSLIFTVLNEAAALPALLDSLATQTRPPDEVIVVDGGSRDETVALLRAEKRFPLTIIEAPGANISRGRNLAIAAASFPVIASVDAGVRVDPHWLERLTAPFAQPSSVPAAVVQPPEQMVVPATKLPGAQQPAVWVGGFFLPDVHSTFDVAMSATVLPLLSDVNASTFLPSSRSVAFLKSAWQATGGYPEWLDYCEDLVFDFKLRASYGQCQFVPDALVYFRPRTSLRAFFKQYYLYARGDGKANLWFKRHMARYATYLLALPVLVAGMVAPPDPIWRWLCAAVAAAGAIAYLRAPYRRLVAGWASLPAIEKLRAAALIPLIRVVGDVAKMLGYPVGVWWRWRHPHASAAANSAAT